MIESFKKRRTQYALGKNIPLQTDAVDTLIRDAIRHAPSSFNSQSSRAIILFGDQSDRLWDIVRITLRGIVPTEEFPATSKRLDGFSAGAGTVLFFEDQNSIKELQEKFPLYADSFPAYSEQAHGMAQFAVWTALANVNIGASLQHYNPLIDAEVARTWDIPESWKLRAQMPFGSNEKPFGEKSFIPDDTRFRTYHAAYETAA